MTFGLIQFFSAPSFPQSLGGMTMGISTNTVYTGAFPLLNWRYVSSLAFGLGITFTGGGSADIVSASHGMKVGYTGDFNAESGGSLPAGITGGNATTYWIVAVGTNTFQVSATNGGSAITFATAGSGNLTFRASTECAWNAGWLDDTTGDLKNPVTAALRWMQVAWWTIPPGTGTVGQDLVGFFDGQQFDVTWSGTATGSKPSFSAYNTGASTTGANSATIVLTSPATSSSNVGIQFAITNPSDPPHNFFISQHQYATNVANGERWNPDFITMLKTTDGGGTTPFGRIRWMDSLQINTNQAEEATQLSTFDDFHLFGSFQPAAAPNINTPMPFGTYASSGLRGGIHPSVVIDLHNQLGINVHWNIPAGFTNQGVLDVATAFHAGLNPNLYVTFEYGNENSFSFSFMGYRYMAGQPYPPLGVSAPYQVAKTITAATPGSPTAINSPAHGLISGSGINVVFSGGTMASTNNTLRSLTVTKIDADNFSVAINTTGLTFSAGTFYTIGAGRGWTGYRAAQMMDVVRGVFGTSSSAVGSRWRGGYGVQMADSSTNTATQAGIDFYVANEAAGGTVITDLFTCAYHAPYFGEFVSSGSNVTGVSVGVNPTVTMNNSFTNGQTIRVFVNGGTMAAVLDGTVSYTVSSRTATNFAINADTTGTAYGGSNNFAMVSPLYDMIDASIAGHTSAPITNPTKYSLFARELGNALINGTNTYGYTPGASYALPLISTNTAKNARVCHRRGLYLECYEGMFNMVQQSGGVTADPKLNEFIINSKFDAGITAVYQAFYTMMRANYCRYPAKYVADGQPGPWQGLRYFPGDASNGQWQAIIAENDLGVFVDPTPAAAWSRTFNLADQFFSSASSTTASLTFTSPGGLVVIAETHTNGATVTSAQVDGTGAMTIEGTDTHSWTSTIMSQVVAAGTHTVVVTYSTGAPFRNLYAITLSGLLSNTRRQVLTVASQSTGNMAILKGSAVIGVCPAVAGTTWLGSDVNASYILQNQTLIGAGSALAIWDPGTIGMSDNGYLIGTGGSNGIMAVTYL